VRGRVEQGVSLASAMKEREDYFGAVYCSLVAAGESSGDLPGMLDRLADMTRKQLHTRNAIIGAMVYPSLLLTITTGVLFLLLLFVIPRFGELFTSMGVALPPTTAALVSIGQALRSYWWALILGLAAAGTALRLWMGSPAGKRAWDGAILHLPQVGPMIRSVITARVTRLLGVLLDGRVPVLEALDLTVQSAGNYRYAALLVRARDSVTRGDPISAPFRDSALVSPSVYEALHNGEQSGQIGPLLLTIADFLDEENEVVIKSLTSILEPVILVAMGLVVGLMAISMFLPLFDLTAMTQGGPR
jgi:type II secretory pathway component PulF